MFRTSDSSAAALALKVFECTETTHVPPETPSESFLRYVRLARNSGAEGLAMGQNFVKPSEDNFLPQVLAKPATVPSRALCFGETHKFLRTGQKVE